MKKITFLFALLLYVATANYIIPAVIYVKHDAIGANNGTSWTDAYLSFQSALSASISGDQIWVAAGTYKPSSAYDLTNTSRYYHFRMKEGVSIYGGFAGTETQLTERNISNNVTILSGDIGNLNDYSDDCYHIFYHPDGLGLTNAGVLDGFTITLGYASSSGFHSHGAGMYNKNNNPSIIRCKFSDNIAVTNGGGIYNDASSPNIINCSFIHNQSGNFGGGIANYYSSSPTITNCTFANNWAQTGGGIGAYQSNFTINNSILWENGVTTGNGRQFYFADCTVMINYSCYANVSNDIGYSGTGGITYSNCTTNDPQYVTVATDPTHPYLIYGTSPGADTGNNDYISISTDIRGGSFSRKLNKADGTGGTVDMGAYEYKYATDYYNQFGPLPVELVSFTAIKDGITVILQWETATEINNYGFGIQRQVSNEWKNIGFVQGHGNSNSPKEYSFTDSNPPGGKVKYRLKQIDFDGKFEYSNEIEVNVGIPANFALHQNYPNPFNPTTTINYSIAQTRFVKISIYDMLGREIIKLVNEEKIPGNYEVKFNGSNLANGIYFYRLSVGNFTQTKKLILTK